MHLQPPGRRRSLRRDGSERAALYFKMGCLTTFKLKGFWTRLTGINLEEQNECVIPVLVPPSLAFLLLGLHAPVTIHGTGNWKLICSAYWVVDGELNWNSFPSSLFEILKAVREYIRLMCPPHLAFPMVSRICLEPAAVAALICGKLPGRNMPESASVKDCLKPSSISAPAFKAMLSVVTSFSL